MDDSLSVFQMHPGLIKFPFRPSESFKSPRIDRCRAVMTHSRSILHTLETTALNSQCYFLDLWKHRRLGLEIKLSYGWIYPIYLRNKVY